MTHQIIENKAVRQALKFKKIFTLCAFLLFSAAISSSSFANPPQNDENHSAENHAVDQNHSENHEAEAHEEHHAEAHEESHGDSHAESEEFNAGDMIMHHISDAHDWHLWDWKGHAVSIPLPIIIYNSSRDKKLSVFMSNKFEHGHAAYEGYKLDHNSIVSADESDESSFIDLSITKNVASIFVAVILLLLVLFSVVKGYKKRALSAPKGLQSILEPIILFIRDEVVKPSIGKGYERFMPLLLTIFFFIFFSNLMGLIPIAPFGANVTGNIAVTMVLAVIVFIVTTAIAKKTYWKHIFLPDVPVWLYPIMIIIEIIGVFIKPFVLMLRLFANITAGHIIILGFFSLIFIFGNISAGGGYGAAVVSVAFSLFMSLLEILVAFLQAYVFTLLSALYFGAALEEHHEH